MGLFFVGRHDFTVLARWFGFTDTGELHSDRFVKSAGTWHCKWLLRFLSPGGMGVLHSQQWNNRRLVMPVRSPMVLADISNGKMAETGLVLCFTLPRSIVAETELWQHLELLFARCLRTMAKAITMLSNFFHK